LNDAGVSRSRLICVLLQDQREKNSKKRRGGEGKKSFFKGSKERWIKERKQNSIKERIKKERQNTDENKSRKHKGMERGEGTKGRKEEKK